MGLNTIIMYYADLGEGNIPNEHEFKHRVYGAKKIQEKSFHPDVSALVKWGVIIFGLRR